MKAYIDTDCESVYLSSSAIKQSGKILQNINNSSGSFVLSLLISSAVVIIVLKSVALVWRKTDFGQSIWLAGNQCNRCVYDSKLPETRVLKEVLVQGSWQESLWKFFILSNIPDLEWCLSNRWKIHSPILRHVYSKHGGELVNEFFTSANYLPRWQRWRA